MDLRGVNLSLDDVEEGDVAVVVLSVSGSRHHHVLGLGGAERLPHHKMGPSEMFGGIRVQY